MIIQGSNNPIVIAFDEEVSEIKDWSISLYGEDKRGAPGELLKHWGSGDLIIDGVAVFAPLTETETMSFMPCVASLEIKWLSPEDSIYHSDVVRVRISGRKDQTKLVDVDTDTGAGEGTNTDTDSENTDQTDDNG